MSDDQWESEVGEFDVYKWGRQKFQGRQYETVWKAVSNTTCTTGNRWNTAPNRPLPNSETLESPVKHCRPYQKQKLLFHFEAGWDIDVSNTVKNNKDTSVIDIVMPKPQRTLEKCIKTTCHQNNCCFVCALTHASYKIQFILHLS